MLNVKPSTEHMTEISFRGDYLGLLEKISKLFHPKFPQVNLKLTSDHLLASAEIKNIDGDSISLGIMPARW